MNETIPTAEECYRLLVEGANDYAMILIDPEGRVTRWNRGAELILGWSQEEVIGQPANLIFTPEDRAADVLGQELQRAIAEGKAMDMRWHLKKDGSRFWADGIMEGLRDETGNLRGFAKILRDATAQKRDDEQRQQAREELREAHQRTAGILESITDAFMAFDADWRFTYVNDQSERVMSRVRGDLLGRSFWDEFPATVGSTFEREYRRAVEEQTSVAFEEFYPPLNIWVEVRAYPSAEGLSVFYQDVTARKRAEEERERLLAQAEERVRREALLNRVSAAIRATTDPEEIQQVAAQALGQALHADRCYFSFYDLAADSNWVGQDYHREDLPSLAGHYRISDFQVNPEDYYSNGRTLVIADAINEDWSFPEALLSTLRQLRVRSTLGVPIFDEGRLVATLTVAMADEPRDWTDDEVRITEAIASQTRFAVEAARLLAEQQARLQKEAMVGRIGVAIRSETDPEVIQEVAAELLGEALRADRCFYLTYDVLGDAATVGRDYRRPDLSPLAGKYRLADFQALIAEVFANGDTTAIPDVRSALSPAIAQVMESFNHRAVLTVPFFDEERLAAALWASSDAPRAWTAQEAALLEQAATLTRTWVEAARVSRKERAIAQQLQAALKPAVPPQVPGLELADYYRPALEEAGVGGDFSDVYAADKGVTFLVVGDLSGKGLAAASQVATVRNMLRYAVFRARTLSGALTNLNAVLVEQSLLSGFATLFVGRYDAHTRRLSYVNCGQDAGLILRAATGKVEAMPSSGPVMGGFSTGEFAEASVTLEKGDVLALFTDGLTEAGPARTALLGGDGVATLLQEAMGQRSAEEIVARIMAGVDAYARGGVRDDQCLLVGIVNA